jgi:ABC transport system ATP-binding/permease protein
VQFIEWMTEALAGDGAAAARRAVVLVTHDRAFLEATATRMLELDGGRGYVHDVRGRGAYAAFLELRAKRRAAQVAEAHGARARRLFPERPSMPGVSTCRRSSLVFVD